MTRRDHQIMQGTLILLASSLFWAQSLHNGLGGDVFWQWAAGRYMIHHHLVLHDDVFSYTLYHKPWVTEEWGYEVLLAALVSGLGGVAFWLMSAGIGTILMVSLAWLLSLRGVKGLKNGLLVLMAAPGLVEFVKDRPQAFSYVFLFGCSSFCGMRKRIQGVYGGRSHYCGSGRICMGAFFWDSCCFY
ncbi:hypothetical protein [Sulfobacillus thermosulfidooxidans]|uniref:hypothetical protein n=1 Tax=Sulfobacillus thermosulfidooxidans TaxID=28034 RepID=UPI000474C1C7|nr:hypothetical protein [Sulfobacillus thermosulfidooxidans]